MNNHYFFTSFFFPLAVIGGFLWQQVSSIIKGSTQFLSRFQLYCCLDDLNFSNNIQFNEFFLCSFVNPLESLSSSCSKNSSALSRYLHTCLPSTFSQCSAKNSFIYVDFNWILSSGQDRVIHFYIKIPEYFVSYFLTQNLVCASLVACTIPKESPSPSNRVWIYSTFILVSIVHLLNGCLLYLSLSLSVYLSISISLTHTRKRADSYLFLLLRNFSDKVAFM